MARLYADEQYPYPVVELLRVLGHDVLTVQEAGKANQKIPDSDVLAFALVRMSFVWVRTGGDRSLCAIERSLSIESSHWNGGNE